jgi:tetratricopeptide (TPR) repeat protein
LVTIAMLAFHWTARRRRRGVRVEHRPATLPAPPARRPPGVCATLLLALLMTARAGAADVTVEATVENQDVVINQAFVLTIAVKGAQNVSPPALYDLDGFDVGYLGPSTQVSFINGRMTASISHRYRVVPLRVGTFQLGPFAVDVQGQRYDTNAITIRVAAGGSARRGEVVAPGGAQGLLLVVEPGKREVYVGERVDLRLTLYIGNVRVRDLQYPVIAADGVTLDKFSQPTEGNGVRDGKRYHTVSLRTTMTPVRPGPVDLAASMAMNVMTNRRGMDPLFDQFFPGDAKAIEVRAEPTPLTVLPLPAEGKPSDFTGAVGRFDFTLSAKPTELDAGDPITLRMEIAGTGNLANVSPPAVPVDDRFRVYDAQPVKGEDGAERRVFEQVVIPQVADVRELPAVSFSYFDPELRTYRTISHGPTPLAVRAAHDARPQVVDANQAAAPEPEAPAQALGRDIVYIKDAPGAWQARAQRFYQRAGFWLLQMVPVALFAGGWAYARRRDRLAADPRLVRFRQAGREARRALAALGDGPADAQFYDALSATLATYLSAKLGLPPGAVDRERVLARLDGDGAGAEMRERLGAFFQLIEQARYAPSQRDRAERVNALALAKGIVEGLERERRLERHLAAGIAVALLCAAAPLSGAGADEATPQTAFFQGNQAYAAGRYDEAIRAYQSVRDSGLESGALDFNLGNAFFKGGQIARAIASYERARRLLPRDPDVQSNLAYAREVAQVEGETVPLWRRLAFPFATRATGGELAVLASLCWCALWLLLTVRVLVPRLRLGLGRAALVAAALYLVLAGSLGLRLASVELRDSAIVTAAGGSSVRFEPSATGTEHFPVAPGTALDVTDERDEWLQVRRTDGRRGWIPRAAVERLQ